MNIVAPLKNPTYRVASTHCLQTALLPKPSEFSKLQFNLWKGLPIMAQRKGALLRRQEQAYPLVSYLHNSGHNKYSIITWASNQNELSLYQRRDIQLFNIEFPSSINRSKALNWMMAFQSLLAPLSKHIMDISSSDCRANVKLMNFIKGGCLELFDLSEGVPSNLSITNVIAESHPSESLKGHLAQNLSVESFVLKLKGTTSDHLSLAGIGLTSLNLSEKPYAEISNQKESGFTSRFTINEDYPALFARSIPNNSSELDLGRAVPIATTEIDLSFYEPSQKISVAVPQGTEGEQQIAAFDRSFNLANQNVEMALSLAAEMPQIQS